jgi:hypothetical protein
MNNDMNVPSDFEAINKFMNGKGICACLPLKKEFHKTLKGNIFYMPSYEDIHINGRKRFEVK